MNRAVFVILACVTALMIGCSGSETRDHAVVAQEVQDEIFDLQEAINGGASEEEVDRRFRLLLDKVDLLIDSAENYDSIMGRFRVLYDEFDEVSGTAESMSEGDSFFRDRGIDISGRLEGAAELRPSRNSADDLEPTNTELRAAANADVSQTLESLIARAELAQRRLARDVEESQEPQTRPAEED